MQLPLDELIASLGCSVSSAQQRIENHSLSRFFEFFETAVRSGESNSTEALSPKTITMSLPRSDDLSKTCDTAIPLPALAHHKNVHLDKVTIKLRTRLNEGDDKIIMADMDAPSTNECDTQDPLSDSCAEINLTFSVSDSSEGVSRVVQNITKTI